ncbi:hypothetical protein [Streptomyces afghaniensis]|uniref:hypothetical protein n=1 Tax=Streptomyces afghaniensis TaxID=66865 RepID=UPI00278665BA|nr:hypothetical protein [Streptomyces afghaniensis]MDQ1013546.1 hypothetical protein [Streptomyces afghaniensis]
MEPTSVAEVAAVRAAVLTLLREENPEATELELSLLADELTPSLVRAGEAAEARLDASLRPLVDH